MKPLTIAIYNHDGGCGKTTTTINLAKHLVHKGQNVLVIDLDPMGRATNRAGITIGTHNSIGDVMTRRNTVGGAKVLTPGGWWCIGADGRLVETAAYLQSKSPNHNYLQRALANLSGFDVVLIDCASSADILTVNMLYATDCLIVPVALDQDSVNDLGNTLGMIGEMDEEDRPDVLGCVLTKVNARTSAYARYKQQLSAVGCGILAEIPKREGVNAEDEIFAAYARLADVVRLEVFNHA